jgi:hypothetical protein
VNSTCLTSAQGKLHKATLVILDRISEDCIVVEDLPDLVVSLVLSHDEWNNVLVSGL